jgi:hypothetical protein
MIKHPRNAPENTPKLDVTDDANKHIQKMGGGESLYM